MLKKYMKKVKLKLTRHVVSYKREFILLNWNVIVHSVVHFQEIYSPFFVSN